MTALETYDRPHQLLTSGEAQRMTQRIKLTASTIRDNMFRLRNLVDEAKNSNVWQVLGFSSWTAYLADALGSEPMRLDRDERRELVDYLAGEGMSSRAIAPIVGVDRKTVERDIRGGTNVPPAESPHSADVEEPVSTSPEVVDPEAVTGNGDGGGLVAGDVDTPYPSPVTVDPTTGEVLDDVPTVTEHTVTEKTRVIVGRDGKTYEQKLRAPKPVLAGDALLDYDAKQTATRVSDALQTLDAFRAAAHRSRVLETWWPRAIQNEEVPPWGLDLFKPTEIRTIAAALNELANELEVHSWSSTTS